MVKPLRRIVGHMPNPDFPSLTVEILECGHWQRPVTDFYGETNAYKRRCKKCGKGLPPDLQIEDDEIES